MRAKRLARVAMLATVATLAAGVAVAGIKVQIDHDPDFDFSPLRTWAWHPKGPGNAVKIITQDDDSAAFKKQFEPRVLPIIEAAFVGRGFPVAGGGDPDFYVTYYALVTVGDSDQYMGQFVNLPQWGLPPVAPQTQSLKVYPQGSLILDVTSRATNEVVWRGVAQAELKWEEEPAARDRRVRDAVGQLVKKFPPKPAKKKK